MFYYFYELTVAVYGVSSFNGSLNLSFDNACLHTIRTLGIKESLNKVFGQKDADNLVLLAIYQYLEAGSCKNLSE